MGFPRYIARVIGWIGLMAAGPELLAQARDRDTTVVARELAAARDEARIPLLLELAELHRSHPATTLPLVDEALELLAKHPSIAFEVVARNARSYALNTKSDYPAALTEAREAERLARQANIDTLIAEALHHVSLPEWRTSRWDEALQHAEAARALFERHGNSKKLAAVHNVIGGVHLDMGQLDAALDAFLASLRVSEAIADEQSVGRAHNNVGLVYWDLHRYDEALAALQRALALHERVGPPNALSSTLNNIGMVLVEAKRPREGVPYLERSLALDRAAGDLGAQGHALTNLGWAYQGLKEFGRALEYQEQALALREKIGDRDGTVRTRGAIAEIKLAQGDSHGGIALLESAIALADSIPDPLDQAELLEDLANARARIGDTARAYVAYRRFHELRSMLQDSSSRRRIADLEVRYRAREQERELTAAKDVAESRRRALRWAAASSVLLGGSLLLLGILYFHRLRVQRALAESEQRYRALFQASGVPTFLIQRDPLLVIDGNEPARGYYREPRSPIDAIEVEWVRRALRRAAETPETDHVELDDRWTDGGGRLRWTEIRGSSVALGGRASLLVTLRDTTALHSEAEARQREDRIRALGVLAGGIAHDFNNALTKIVGQVELAREGDPAEREAMLGLAVEAAIGARRLTGQLLAFARGGEPVRRPTDVRRLLRDSVMLAGSGSTMRIRLEIPDDLWVANLDAGQFGQVVSNLVINAQQATPKDGLLVVRASNFQGTLGPGVGSTERRYLRLEFQDNGAGIPAAIREQIFDPYFTTKTGGTGLGLTTALTICRNHGGTLTLDSREGLGTTCTAYFPATTEPAEQPPRLPASAPARAAKVLVLDDEPMVRSILERMLAQWGHQVEAVADGRTAVDRYLTELQRGVPFQFMIMDLTIPGGMGGRQAMAEILKHDAGARAIVASGYSDDPTMAHFREAGFLAALPKPFQQAELAQVVSRVMETDPIPAGS